MSVKEAMVKCGVEDSDSESRDFISGAICRSLDYIVCIHVNNDSCSCALKPAGEAKTV